MYEALTLAEGIGMVIKLYSLGFFFFFFNLSKNPIDSGRKQVTFPTPLHQNNNHTCRCASPYSMGSWLPFKHSYLQEIRITS